MGNYLHLKDVIAKYYIRDGNRVVFRNNTSLNQMALKMWDKLHFSEIDSSVLSKVINGTRLFTFKQLKTFCDILELSKKERRSLFNALIKDKLGEMNATENTDNIHLALAKISYSSHQNTIKLSNKSKRLFEEIMAIIAPRLNQKSKLGVKYSASCYYHFITKGVYKYNSFVENKFANFDVAIPICDFNKTVKGLENNCKCGYHLALYGIIKEYLKKRIFTHERIQNKLNRWVSFFFPKYAALSYLENLHTLNIYIKIILKK